MMTGELAQTVHTLLLFLVAGTPLLLAFACCTPAGKICRNFLPWAAVPALITVFLVPLDLVVEVPWFFMGGRMGLDETGRVFLCLTAFIWLLAGFNAQNRHSEVCRGPRFTIFFLAAMAGNFGLILAQGMLGFYLFFALMSFSAYGLVVYNGSQEAIKAGRIYLVLVMIGEVAMFLALVILADNVNSLALKGIAGSSMHPVALVFLFVGFGVKIGAIPLHGWMPLAYQQTPIPAATALAGAMVNAGILGWLRFLPLGEIISPQGALLFVGMGFLATFYGVIIGLGQKKAGTILAYSSISQMGLMTIIFGLGLTSFQAGRQAATILILYTVHHALAKSSLFLGYDVKRDSQSAWHLAGLLLPSLALAGLPFTSGAIAKTGFKELAASLGEPWAGLSAFFLPLSAIGTTLLMLHFITILWRTPKKRTPANITCKAVWIFSLMAVGIVLWLWPMARSHASHSLSLIKLWHALWPVVIGCLLYFGWHWTAWYRSTCSIISTRDLLTFYNTYIAFDWCNAYQNISNRWQKKTGLLLTQNLFSIPLSTIYRFLRKLEKILGRWTIAGLSYLLFCVVLLFLLR